MSEEENIVIDPVILKQLMDEAWPEGRPVGPAGQWAAFENLTAEAIAQRAFDDLPDCAKEDYTESFPQEEILSDLAGQWTDYCLGDRLTISPTLSVWLEKIAPRKLAEWQRHWVDQRDAEAQKKYRQLLRDNPPTMEEALALVKQLSADKTAGKPIDETKLDAVLDAVGDPQVTAAAKKALKQIKATGGSVKEPIVKPQWSPAKCLQIIRVGIPLEGNPVAGVIKCGDENGVFYLQLTNGDEIKLGCVAELTKAEAIKNAVADSTGVMINPLGTKARHQLAQAILWLAKPVEMDTEREETSLWVRSFMMDRAVHACGSDRDLLYEALKSGSQVIESDGKLHVHLPALKQYLKSFMGELINQHQLGLRLRKIGGEKIDLQARFGKNTISLKYWFIPTSLRPEMLADL